VNGDEFADLLTVDHHQSRLALLLASGDGTFRPYTRIPIKGLTLARRVEGDLDPARAVSNTFEMEWPRKSGRMQSFPEIDRVEWFDLGEARKRLKTAQVPFIDRLVEALAESS
jgi:predicted NUDIX family NTP pyrophosphohydrolase